MPVCITHWKTQIILGKPGLNIIQQARINHSPASSRVAAAGNATRIRHRTQLITMELTCVNLSGCPSPRSKLVLKGLWKVEAQSVRSTQNECEGAVGGTRVFDERLPLCSLQGLNAPQWRAQPSETGRRPHKTHSRRSARSVHESGRESLSVLYPCSRRYQAKHLLISNR